MINISYFLSNWRTYVRRCLWPLPRLWRERDVVVMVDGKRPHGGVTDRFRNILSLYSYCKANGIRFRVYYFFPTPLTEYLVPNEYDWRISHREISYHRLDSRDIKLYVRVLPELEKFRAYPGLGQNLSDERLQLARAHNREYNNNLHLTVLDREFSKKRHCQYHMEMPFLHGVNLGHYLRNCSGRLPIWRVNSRLSGTDTLSHTSLSHCVFKCCRVTLRKAHLRFWRRNSRTN